MTPLATKDVILFDLDKTLTDHSHRDHLAPPAHRYEEPGAWLDFNMASADDRLIDEMAQLYFLVSLGSARWNRHEKPPVQLVLMTSRQEAAREITEEYFANHGLVFDDVIMRPDEQGCSPAVFKRQAIEAIGPERVLLAIDDDETVADMLNELGITCLRVMRP